MSVFVARDTKDAHPSTRLPDEWLVVPHRPRVRGLVDGSWAIDSSRARLVWPPGAQVPRYAFPLDDLGVGLQRHATRLQELGEGFDEPLFEVDWDTMDAWFEEDQRVRVHPLDPFHRIDLRQSSRHLVVQVGGTVVCDSNRPLLLFETGLPTRYYVPLMDVRLELLEPSETVTRCAYKGEARHWHVLIDGEPHEDVCWSYPFPNAPCAQIQDLVCFYDERIGGLTVDGVHVVPARTQWSRD